MTKNPILTIGHSNHSLDKFLALLARHRINAVADVRSAPYSRFNPHFNRPALAGALKSRGIAYAYLGRELGGRSDDPACYQGGRIRYERVARTGKFQKAIARVMAGAGEHRIALMCAEKEPLDCHRTLLVARALDERGVAIEHILAEGGLESYAEALDRLMEKHDLVDSNSDMFAPSREESVNRAMALQAERVAFVSESFVAESESEIP